MTAQEIDKFKEYILQAEQAGRSQTTIDTRVVRVAIEDNVLAHVDSFRITFLASAAIALLGGAVLLRARPAREPLLRRPGLRPALALDLRQRGGNDPGITRHPPREAHGPAEPAPPGDRSG